MDKAIVAVFTDGGDGVRYHIGNVVVTNVTNADNYLQVLRSQWDCVTADEIDDRQDSDFIDWLIDNKHAEAPPMDVTYVVLVD